MGENTLSSTPLLLFLILEPYHLLNRELRRMGDSQEGINASSMPGNQCPSPIVARSYLPDKDQMLVAAFLDQKEPSTT